MDERQKRLEGMREPINETMELMDMNLQRVELRQPKIDAIDKNVEELDIESHKFRKNATDLHRTFWRQNCYVKSCFILYNVLCTLIKVYYVNPQKSC